MKTRFNFSSSLLILSGFMLFALNSVFAQNTNVYVSAHPDDWQLFMNPNAYHNLQNPNNRVVFLHTTAGDAGSGTGNTNYYLAREEGSLRAIRFLCNAINYELKQGDQMSQTQVIINNHLITRFSYANAVAYFLRLPDGNYLGPGYPIHHQASLKNFNDGTKSSISAIDGSTIYNSPEDLIETIVALVKLESADFQSVEFNIADTNATINPGDHSDHLQSSFLLQKVAGQLGMTSVRLYQEYATNALEMNVFDQDFLTCAGTWGATASGLSDNYHDSTWNDTHNIWIGRQYFRDVLLSDLEKE